MILSVSRRTDIPNYFSDWFFQRMKEGFVYVSNPMNPHQVSEINLSPEVVDCIVFWTKNPEPMMARLEELRGYHYYFQFTLTGYGTDIECNIPHKKDVMIPVFQRLSTKIGKEKVVWRYDPILFTNQYTPEYHLNAFSQIADALRGYTDKCVISFVDTYAKNRKGISSLNVYDLDEAELFGFAKSLSDIAGKNGMEIGSCAEETNLELCGIRHHSCIDQRLIEKIIGCGIKAYKDKNQRKACGCIESIDIGAYDTCKNGCIYCYANDSQKRVEYNCTRYNPFSPILCGEITEADRVTRRNVKSVKESQMSIFDVV